MTEQELRDYLLRAFRGYREVSTNRAMLMTVEFDTYGSRYDEGRHAGFDVERNDEKGCFDITWWVQEVSGAHTIGAVDSASSITEAINLVIRALAVFYEVDNANLRITQA